MEKIGEIIKYLRAKKGMTQEELAGAAGIAKSSLCNYENGRRTPPDSVIRAIAEELEVPEETFSSYMQGGGPSVRQNLRKFQEGRKRTARAKKLLDAFYRLSDKAQAKAIEHVEDLARVPEYRITLEDVLQQYACRKDHLAYGIENRFLLESEEIYREHIILRHGREQPEMKRRNFIYYSFPHEEDDADEIRSTAESLMQTDEPLHILTLVFDNLDVLNEFYDCYVYLREQMDMLMEDYPVPDAFLLVEKGTWEILDVLEYE